MTSLSVNINKIASIRNARGGMIPNVKDAAVYCQANGAQGITVHPRPDERHITYQDVLDIKPIIITEFNIEGNPIPKFMDLVLKVLPCQVTLVPDGINALTSNAGWDTKKEKAFLTKIVSQLKNVGIRTSIFIGADIEMIKHAVDTGVDRIELYTEPYATDYNIDKDKAVEAFVNAATIANDLGLEVNAGHDLSLENLRFFVQNVKPLHEVSIGHALISDALYYGLNNTIKMYLEQIKG